MAPFYKKISTELGWKQDTVLLKELEQKNSSTLKSFDEKAEDALKNAGETEYSDALIAKAFYLARIGEKDVAVQAYDFAIEKTAPIGVKIDLHFGIIRIGFFHQDSALIHQYIEKVKVLIEKGGDWDRRNRLKTYQGIYLISKREFKEAVDYLLDTLATFTSTELMQYKEFVRYAILTASLILDRPNYKKKVLDSPEILECIHQLPHLSDFAQAFYNCQYASFFKGLAAIEKTLKMDVYLAPHSHYFVREMRIRVYGQVLESYKSVTITSLATQFGVTEEWIDQYFIFIRDLARFISSGRLNAVIDKVNGIVLTNRPDAKNAQYQASIREGDNLLNSIQKLSRVINV